MQKTFVKEHWPKILLGFGIFLQVLILIVFNLTRLPYESNFDSSCAYAQIVEIWRQKSLILKDWSYQTTLGIDSPVLLGALFYGLVKNPFLAFGLANLVTITIYLFLFWDILKQAGTGHTARLATLLVLLTPYSIGQLGYMPMLFTSAGSYAYKLLVPLLLIDLMVCMHNGGNLKKRWPLLAGTGILTFLTAYSSGPYVLLVGIFPILAYEVWHVLLENDWKKIGNLRIAVLLADILIFLVGWVLGNRLDVTYPGREMTLTKAGDFPGVVGKCLTGILQLFGAVPEAGGIPVMQRYGMMYLFRFVLCVCILASWIFLLHYLKKDKKYMVLTGIITFLFLINTIVIIFADVTYSAKSFEFRYHLISMLPMLLLTGPALEILVSEKLLVRQAVTAGIFAVFAIVNFFGYRDYMIDNYNSREEILEITDLARENEAGLIITMGKGTLKLGRTLRGMDPNLEVSVWRGYNQGAAWGVSSRYYENSHYSGPVIVLSTKKNCVDIPEYLSGRMKNIKTVGKYQVYKTEENIFDADSTIPVEGKNVDFFYSQGYELTGKLLSDQTIEITEEEKEFLRSGKKGVNTGTIDLDISYEMEAGTKAWIFVIDDKGNVLSKERFKTAKKKILLKDVEIDSETRWIRYLFYGNKGGRIKINSIDTCAKLR